MTEPLNWGLLSTARINQAVIPGLQRSEHNRLYGVASRSLEKAEPYARQWSIPKSYGSYEEMLADPAIQVVYNSLPNHLHAEWTIRACQEGKHVLCEKPLCLSVEEADAIIRAAEQNNVVVAEAFMYRHHPQTEAVQKLVSEGALGELCLIAGTFTFSLNRTEDVRWLLETGGGSLLDVGCYPVSYARMLAGEPPVEVFGSQVEVPSGVDATFTGQMRYPGGLMAQFSSSFRVPHYARMEIQGENGTLEIPNPFKPGRQPEVTISRGDDVQTLSFPDGDIYQGEIENMADAILRTAPTRLPLVESRENIATLVALRESAETGRPVLL